ncbi:aldehyde dehydrogenase family protein [Saccharopolyspora sp. HNM0986]|uniref:aldehyde dehydrogenase family protein n=1 Tax=Saccharopolyspora galaxeae TaxID=2781241 RepID=UPI001909E2F6|nr:aldehyde dehydrogenase family protein [Saccharopolyspora sp. HNM0986]MBK0870102.1 aldehyde dehydrogenase family protein [Saccharopolyspora sp. HNM0986]
MTFPSPCTWIDGRAEQSRTDDGASLRDPNTGAELAPSRSSSSEQIDRAVGATAGAHADGRWSSLGAERRAPFLRALADGLDARADEIARLDAINSGVPISVTRLFASSNGDTVRSAADRALALGDAAALPADGRDVRIHRVPWGPAALLMPWNAPSAMAVKKLGFALAAGASAVMKPSPASPWSALLVAEAAAEAGIPDGVVNLVLGGAEAGSRLVEDERIAAISMTGSTPTGRAIAAAAAPRFAKLRLELGSNNPAIVLPDADVEVTAKALAGGAMKLSGQWCEAPRRVLASRAVRDRLVEGLRAELATLRIGSSLDDTTTLGPVAFEGRRQQLTAQRDVLAARGATIVETGLTPDEGFFFPPTLAVGEAVEPDSEIFGPLLTIEAFDEAEDAVRRANSGQVGLAGYVFSEDIDEAGALGARLVAGEVKVNGTSVLDMSPHSAQSFFGSSGIGGHGDAELLEFFLGKRIVGTDAPGLPL